MVSERRLIVIDASVALNVIFPAEPFHAQAAGLFRTWLDEAVSLIAPPIFESEADSGIRTYVYLGLITRDAGAAAQNGLDALGVEIVQDARARRRAREIAAAFNQRRVYDATYCALAELMGCEFWTADRAFHRAVRESLGYVRFVEEAGE